MAEEAGLALRDGLTIQHPVGRKSDFGVQSGDILSHKSVGGYLRDTSIISCSIIRLGRAWLDSAYCMHEIVREKCFSFLGFANDISCLAISRRIPRPGLS